MGQKNFEFPAVDSEPVRNTSYFFPLSLQMVAEEKQNFYAVFKNRFLHTIENKKALYTPHGNVAVYFPKTVEQTNKFLQPINLRVRNMTLFIAPPTADVRHTNNIHVDGVRDVDGSDTILEARFSYYEMSDVPGIVRWYPPGDQYQHIKVSVPGKEESSTFTLDWIQQLKERKIGMEDAPDWTFATSTNTPSGIIRTNIPHHVIQGGSTRITVSCQLVWADTRSPRGVWQHIEENYAKLGI